MFLPLFTNMRDAKLPVSLREYLDFLAVVKTGMVLYDIEGFYYLARTALVKDERNLDKFDRIFAATFKGMENLSVQDVINAVDIPEEWLRKMAEKQLSPAEMAEIEALGGFDKLMETLKERLKEQEGRHQGGSKWIGTAGTSPFGAHGYNPEGVRIGQDQSRHQRAVKVWDKREFRNLDDSVELGTRNIKVALKRLRRWARDGADEELDLNGTIRATAEHGYLDIKTRPERRNAVKVLLFLDVGGSMDPYIRLVEELFSAAKTEFKHLEYFYFHNCLYEGVWKDNRRRWQEQTPTHDILNKYGANIITPLGTLLQNQVMLSIGGEAPKAYAFGWCEAIGCIAKVGFTGLELESLKKSKDATITISAIVNPSQPIVLSMNLDGFSEGFKAVLVKK